MIKDSVNKVIAKLLEASDMECSKWPDGDWHHCCVIHDYDYVEGVNKFKADIKLARCVMEASWRKGGLPRFPVAHIGNGLLMWLGVTIFGWKPYLSYRKARKQAGENR